MSVVYSHLSAQERAVIMLGRKSGQSLRFISKQIGRAVSTLSREIKRCALIDYDATYAGKMYTLRRRNCRRKPSLVFGSDLYRYVYN